MVTAMEERIDTRQKENRDRVFAYQMEAFQKRWAPQDRYENAVFQTELMMLVRQIYTEAQAPILETMAKTATLMPWPYATRELVPATRGVGETKGAPAG